MEIALDLVRQGPVAVRKNHPCRSLQEHLVFLRHLIRMPQKYAARLVVEKCLGARANQSGDLVVEYLPVTGPLFIPYDEVDRQSFKPPVGMRLYQFCGKLDPRRITDPQKNNGQVAGDAVGPQARLSTRVFKEQCLMGSAITASIDDRTCQPAV